jgi:WD40 repeat protein
MEHADIVTGVHSTTGSYPYVITSSMDRTLKLWNIEKGGGAAQTFHSSSPAWCSRWGELDKNLVAGGYQDGRVRVWDSRIPSGKEIQKPTLSLSLGSPVYSLLWHPTVPLVFIAGTEAGGLFVYDVRHSKAPLVTNSEHLASIRSLEFCPWSPSLLASASDDTSVRIFNLNVQSSGGASRISSWSIYSEHTDYVRGVAWSHSTWNTEGKYKNKTVKGLAGRLISASWDYNVTWHKVGVYTESKESDIYPMSVDEEEEAETLTPHSVSGSTLSETLGDAQSADQEDES